MGGEEGVMGWGEGNEAMIPRETETGQQKKTLEKINWRGTFNFFLQRQHR